MLERTQKELASGFAKKKDEILASAIKSRAGGEVVLADLVGRLEVAQQQDHATYLLDGKPLVTIYRMEVVVENGIATVQAKYQAVRFIEGRNTQEVLDFNLFLSPRDVWTRPVGE